MYIAFRWLIGLTLAMWISMCGIDIVVKRNIEIKQYAFNLKMFEITGNTTVAVKPEVESQEKKHNKPIIVGSKSHNVAFLHCFMFFAGALIVTLYNRKHEIILFTKRTISEINTKAFIERLQDFSIITSSRTCDILKKYSQILWEHTHDKTIKLWNKLFVLIRPKELQKSKINVILLKKLKEIGEERKNLGQLLIAAIHENKNIRMQYQLENLAKNRLAQHIENTQKLIRENRSRYVSFQQLYLVTHQENSFLKSRIQKLVREKEKAEKNLLDVLNEVYKSKNNELKHYCSRFIVRTTENLLNSDIGAEIQKFLEKSRSPPATTSNWQLTDAPGSSTRNWPKCANPRFAEIVQDDILVPLVSDAPKLKGLPGERIMTVKDKDGLIEKLYEYDYESDLDVGDTIRRIRQYSVYFDKDCLLDFSNSRTVMSETASVQHLQTDSCACAEGPAQAQVANQGFLTGSEAFQKFMETNKNVISTTPRLPGLPLLSA